MLYKFHSEGKGAYNPGDLFLAHPSKPHTYKMFGRMSDQIMLTTGLVVQFVLWLLWNHLANKPFCKIDPVAIGESWRNRPSVNCSQIRNHQNRSGFIDALFHQVRGDVWAHASQSRTGFWTIGQLRWPKSANGSYWKYMVSQVFVSCHSSSNSLYLRPIIESVNMNLPAHARVTARSVEVLSSFTCIRPWKHCRW